MKIQILRIGHLDLDLVKRIEENLNTIFSGSTCGIAPEELSIPEEAFDSSRKQYRSDTVLQTIKKYAEENKYFDRVLGIADVDIFVPRLNFVFGEAECPGKAALISLWRLRPEFYGESPSRELFDKRSIKEAVHELGHTLGLEHCPNPFCVMHFSNSIYETDVKHILFCNQCSSRAEMAIAKLGENLERKV